eukprot:5879803-Amphidinium_carterae.1
MGTDALSQRFRVEAIRPSATPSQFPPTTALCLATSVLLAIYAPVFTSVVFCSDATYSSRRMLVFGLRSGAVCAFLHPPSRQKLLVKDGQIQPPWLQGVASSCEDCH